MKNHIIICGIGTTSVHVVEELYKAKTPFVAIESDINRLENLKKIFPGITIIDGDGTSDATLQEANVEKAGTLVATLSNDKDNLFLTLTARMMNPEITIIARAIDYNLQSKLKKAGASYVISPNFIGGQTISSQILKPNVHSFLEKMRYSDDADLNIHEIVIPTKSHLIGKTLQQAEISKKTSLNIIAYAPEYRDTNYVYNPSGNLIIKANSVLLFIGSNEQEKILKQYVGANEGD